MMPTLITLAGIPVSSFGIILLIAFIVSTYFIWKLALFYELQVEKVIDLVFVALLGGLIGARVYFILFHPQSFDSITKMFFITKYPGLAFWGGLVGGLLILKLASQKFKFAYWMILDFAIVGLFIAISITSIGCLLSSCQVGLPSDWPIAVSQIGLVGKRFPIQIIEAIIFLFLALNVWKAGIRFHKVGQVAYRGIFLFSVTKFILDFFRGDTVKLVGFFTVGQLFSVLFFLYGLYLFYKINKRSFSADLKFFGSLFTNTSKRKLVVSRMVKICYTQFVALKFAIKRFPRHFSRRLNVKSNPPRF